MYIPNFSISRQYPQSMRNLKDLFYASIEVTIGIYRNAFIQKMGYGRRSCSLRCTINSFRSIAAYPLFFSLQGFLFQLFIFV